LTNSFAVSFSSKAWSTAAFIDLRLPLKIFIWRSWRRRHLANYVSKGCAKPITD
jgi:hypothetical protein